MWASGLVVAWGLSQAWGPGLLWLANLWESAVALRFLGSWALALTLAWGFGYLSCLLVLEGRLAEEVLRRQGAEAALSQIAALQHVSSVRP